jgi:ATP-dependent DNA helicase RecQ
MEELLPILHKYWGYESFRPLQAEAMRAVVAGRDSVVVMPTGGGKSLCFQAPALHLPGLAVIVSPLIALMKDQVDALRQAGAPAACVNSSQTASERRLIAESVKNGHLKLLYLSPEKLMTERTLEFLQGLDISLIAIDEAHCISDWGHDFRPEYRMLHALKEKFPKVGVHAYTATATEQVRLDIAKQLKLQEPAMLVGSFDRPNLIYRVQRIHELWPQVREILARHRDKSGVIYCIRRADVDSLTATMQQAGYSALPYHAGLSDQDRVRNQEAFLTDRAKIMVATVAFGMGIDKSDVRFVIHTGAPKGLEHYQQESGRAGRDGLESECTLLYSPRDFATWKHLQRELTGQAMDNANRVLAGIERFCISLDCRRRAILDYFGEDYTAESCQACDVCLSELEMVSDPLILAQKILSCVVRLEQMYGAEYTALVLHGSSEERIIDKGHNALSTYGLLKDQPKKQIRDWIEQLVGQGHLLKDGEYGQLRITPTGRKILRGELTPKLLKAAKQRKASAAAVASWTGVDRGLFEELRQWRKGVADEKCLPPFVIFSDATLRDLARWRPTAMENLAQISGIGEKKLVEYGAPLKKLIKRYCDDNRLETNLKVGDIQLESAAPPPTPQGGSAAKQQAWQLFEQNKTLEEVAGIINRATSTTQNYLVEFILAHGITEPGNWIEAEAFEQIREAAQRLGVEKLKPIHDEFQGAITFDQIRIALACLRNEMPSAT